MYPEFSTSGIYGRSTAACLVYPAARALPLRPGPWQGSKATKFITYLFFRYLLNLDSRYVNLDLTRGPTDPMIQTGCCRRPGCRQATLEKTVQPKGWAPALIIFAGARVLKCRREIRWIGDEQHQADRTRYPPCS
eukprot:SAG31_NODE_24415_length_481_cov_13.015707_1_plen_134_part_01